MRSPRGGLAGGLALAVLGCTLALRLTGATGAAPLPEELGAAEVVDEGAATSNRTRAPLQERAGRMEEQQAG